MADFSTADNKFSFSIDGKPHVLPGLTYAHLEAFGATEDPAKRAKLMEEVLFEHAPKRTVDAIKSLSPVQVGQLFREYAGLTPGELPASSE